MSSYNKLRKKIKSILFEAYGISNEVVDYAEFFSEIIASKLLKDLKNKKEEIKNPKETPFLKGEIKIDLQEILRNFSDKKDKFLKFPIFYFQTSYNVRAFGVDKMPIGFDYEAEWQMSPNKNMEIDGEMLEGTSFIINSIFYIREDQEISYDLIYNKVETIILHELTHAKEFFERNKKKKTPKDVVKNIIAIHGYEETRDIRMKKFFRLIYYSISFELNARVAEFLGNIRTMQKEGKDRKQILEEFKKTEVWRVLEELEKFSADNFYKEIDALAKSVQKDTDGVLQRNIMNFFNKAIEKYNIPKEQSNKFLELTKLRPINFLKYWEKQFKEVSQNHKRKLYKVLSTQI